MRSHRRLFLKSTLACVPYLALPRIVFGQKLPPRPPAPTTTPPTPTPSPSPITQAGIAEYARISYNVDKFMKVHATVTASTVTLQAQGSDLAQRSYPLTENTLKLLFVAEKPDGSQIELGIVSYPYLLTVARNALPASGWVALTGQVIVGSINNKFQVNSLFLGGTVTKVPSAATRILSWQHDAGRPDWLTPPERYTHPNVQPYALKPLPSQKGIAPTAWICEKPWGAGHHSGDYPRWRKIKGLVQPERIKTNVGTWLLGPAIDARPYYPTYGGVPGITNTTPYATVRGHPSGGRGPQWIELDGYGRFWGYNRDGSVTGMGGYRMPSDLYEIPDETLSTFHTVGSFPDGPLKHPHDFAYDFIDRKFFYVADSANNRLVRISRHAAAVTGQPEDFSKWVYRAWGASFVYPTSIDSTADGRIYVVDKIGLWSVDRATGNKTLLFARPDLFWVRCLSTGQVCVISTMSVIYRIDPISGNVVTLADLNTPSEWPVISPDLGAHVGPRDSLYVINSPHYSYRLDQNGAIGGPMYFRASNGVVNVGDLSRCYEALHYAWNLEMHPEEPYLFARGFAWSLPALYRPKQPSEEYLSAYDAGLAGLGYVLMQRGTVPGFPWGARPSFTSLRAEHGYNGLGLPLFDEIQAMPFDQRIAYLKGGMGSNTPRPEIVGDYLRAMLYWVWRNSNQFIAGEPLVLPPVEADKTAPIISNVQVSRTNGVITWRWKTDRPALCYVRFADRQPMYRWTPLENSFSTDHVAVGNHADYAVYYQICALGSNGVLTEGVLEQFA
jgi:hypothetical protein